MTQAATIIGLDRTGSAFDEASAKQTALRMSATFGSRGAARRINERLAAWTGDTRRDGDTPKAFWEMVLKALA